MKQENRIQINGEWYVKESSIKEKNQTDVTHTESYISESDDYCFEATKIFKGDSEQFYDGIGMKITNKNTNKTEYWDNDNYLKAALDNNPETIREINDYFDNNTDVAFFLWFLSYLQEKNWL